MKVSRQQFLQELQLKNLIKKIAFDTELEHLQEQKEILAKEHKLRRLIRKFLIEAKVADKVPHASTGINVLEDLLKKVLPIIEQGFKVLTTSEEQRMSYRAHILNAMMRTISPPRSLKQAEVEYLLGTVPSGPMSQQDDDMFQQKLQQQPVANTVAEQEFDPMSQELGPDMEQDVFGGGPTPNEPGMTDLDGDGLPDEKDAFIDVDGDGEPDPVADFGGGLETYDMTGRNMAYDAFQKIEKQILEAYDLLHNDSDRQIFYNYLLTNVKLYFDKYETEMLGAIPEPTTGEYEDEKQAQADFAGAAF